MDKKLDLKVGFSCNNNCIFCVQAYNKGKKDKTTAEIKKDLEGGRKNGALDVVFTGGEPTIRDDIFEIVAYAKKLGYRAIQIQTNGRMFRYRRFCEKLIACGANEFLPAIHGHTEELHDFLTSSKGSFRQVTEGIRNLKALGQTVIANTVIVKSNYRHLPDISRLLISLEVDQFQLAFVHPEGNAFLNFDRVVPLKTLVMPYVHESIDIAKKSRTGIMVEAYPFCFMRGFEEYCSEKYIPPTEVRKSGSVDKDFTKTRQICGKEKSEDCRRCRMYAQCEGPWKEYPQKRGWSEFRPIGVI